MHVYGPSHVHGPQSIGAPHHGRELKEPPSAAQQPAADELSISDAGNQAAEAAGLAGRVKHLPEVRQERIDEIRTQIAAGTYETQQKLDLAVERLLDELG